jgi:hypothetical protein
VFLLHEVPAEHEMIDQHGSIAEGEPVQATHGQWPLLMGRKPPHRYASEAEKLF